MRNRPQITPIALKLLQSFEARHSQKEELEKVYTQLGNPGTAERTAQIVLDCLHGRDGDEENRNCKHFS